MYKTILRTVSALSITTISLTASMSFAVHPAHDLNLDCTDPVYRYTEDCRSELGIKPVTTDVWKNSFESDSVPPATDPNPTSRRDQFISPEASVDHYEREERVNLKLDTDGNGRGDTVVGTSVFYVVKTGNEVNHYAGIRIDADLGAPITEAFPEAVWKTRFKAVGFRTVGGTVGADFYVNEIFDLTVKFIGTSDGTQTRTMGEISGYIQDAGYYGYKIDAQFNNAGVITGTDGITYGRFENAQAEPTDTIAGNLTGIIGERGTLGAFHSDGNSNSRILGFAGGFRANGYSEDELVVLRKCVLDPFHAQCSEDKFDDLKGARIELCTQGNNASEAARLAKPHECHNAVVAEGCILNPFQTKCTGEESDFNQYSAVAQSNRAAFCDNSVNAKDAFCKVGTIVTDVCVDDPFHAICGDGYDEPRNTAVQTCLTTGVCTDRVLARPNAGTWANSFKTKENMEGLDDVPDVATYDYDKPFLKNIEDVQMNTAIEIQNRYLTTSYTSVDLSTAKFNISDTPDDEGTDLGGDAKDGVAYFRGRPRGGQYEYSYSGYRGYVGILSTTDLGAPVTDEEGTASWVGSFAVYYGSYSRSSQDFVLEVNFDTQSIEAFIEYGRHDRLIRGKYNDSGVISGTATRDDFRDNNRDKPDDYYRREATLTGLIGKEGAVGAFGSRNYNGGFVARPADLVVDETTGKNAETFLNGLCEGNPFHDFCYLSNHRKTRIDDCITDNNAGMLRCAKAIEYESCIYNPFDEECKTTFVGYNASPDKPDYQIARAKRSAFCNKDANVADNFCTGAEQAALCSYDPFNAICADAIYDNARKAVCRSELDSGRCANYQPSGNVTTASWLYKLYKDNGFVLPTEPDATRRRSQFLQGTKNGLDNGDVEIQIYSSGTSTYSSLNLNTATFDGLELGRDKNDEDRANAAADGVAFFRGSNYTSYAGIFSGTDLGAPLDRPTTAKWYGQFKGWRFKTDFTLDVTFDGTVGTVDAFVNLSDTAYYLLSGDFDRSGVISGTAKLGRFNNHDGIVSGRLTTFILTGLIGAEGAVGVFNDSGFVAVPKEDISFDPNVKASDWVRSFGNTPGLPYRLQAVDATDQTLFVRGAETGLFTQYLRDAVLQTLTLADDRDGVSYASGEVRWRITRSYNTRTAYHYAGILSGTNLGAALPTVPAGANGAITATWYGKLGLIADGSEVAPRDIDLTVDFTNKRISHSSDVGGEHLVNFSATWKSGVGYDGILDGVFTGDITYDATPTLHNGIYVANDNSKSDGTVTGLIGQQGVVGAFISDEGSVTPYAGGFVATPGVDHLAWVNSFSNPSDLPAMVPGLEPQHQTRFVQGTGTGLDTRNVNDPVLQTLKLADGDLGGEAADGVAYMFTNWRAPNAEGNGVVLVPRHFAGLLSGTSLGLPLSTVPAGANGAITAIWDGKLGLMANAVEIPKRDIDLTVDFTNNKISYSDAVNGEHFVDLNAKWINDNIADGVLKGTITYNPGAVLDNLDANSTKNSAGIVTGLIGQQGAVGAFRSNHVNNPIATHTSFAGGFVAVPVVKYPTWVHSFGDPTSLPASVPWYEPQRQTRFLQGRETDLKPGFINNPVPRSLTLANGDLGGEVADGVAYMSGTWDVDNSDVPRHYAGILSGTHLGAPLDASVAATWSGKLGMIVDLVDVPPRDITLNINFASKTISHSSAVNGAHFVDLSAKWINDDSADGVLKGTITYNPGAALNDATNSAGKVTGLIGQQGAVGAFISNPDNPSSKASYAGGFVAAPTQ